MEQDRLENFRYGIDIRGDSAHAEAHDINEIFALLAGYTGRVHVIDRENNSLVFEGRVDEVRKELLRANSEVEDAVM